MLFILTFHKYNKYVNIDYFKQIKKKTVYSDLMFDSKKIDVLWGGFMKCM